MKDFQEFRKTITQEMAAQWCEEIHSDVIAKVDTDIKDDPVAWNVAYHHSFNFALTMRALEQYHKWLHE